jgi:hypothetical protein
MLSDKPQYIKNVTEIYKYRFVYCCNKKITSVHLNCSKPLDGRTLLQEVLGITNHLFTGPI